MLRTPERPHRHQGGLAIKPPCHPVYFGGLQRLGERQRWKNRGQARGKHSPPGAGGADHNHVVATRRGYFHSTLDVLLALYVARVEVVKVEPRGKDLRGIALQRGYFLFPFKKPYRLLKISDRVNFNSLYNRRFWRVVLREYQSAELLPGGLDSDRQHPLYRP